MSYLVVARKYRPAKFSEIASQKHITQTLQNAIRTDRISQGYIFSGSRGVGKTTAARILAKSLNCEKILSDRAFREKAEPCNACKSCQDFDENRSLNIFEFDGASNNGVDDVRELREHVRYAPQQGRYRVYIIDEFHMLTTQAFNAFLKTLEEPPPHAVFILATTELHKVPLTVSSRCQKFIFKRISSKDIQDTLKMICSKEGIEIEDEALALISQKADGAMRDAQSIMDQVISFCSSLGGKIMYRTVSDILNTIGTEYFFRVSDAAAEDAVEKMLSVSAFIYENGYDATYFVTELIKHFRNFLICKSVKSAKIIEATDSDRSLYQENVDAFSFSSLSAMIASLCEAERDMRLLREPVLRLELVLIKLIALAKLSDDEASKISLPDDRLLKIEQAVSFLSEEVTAIKKKL